MKGDKTTCKKCGAVVFEKGFYRHTTYAHKMTKDEYIAEYGEPEVFRDEESEMVLNSSNNKEDANDEPLIVEIITKNDTMNITHLSTKDEVFMFLKSMYPNIKSDQFIESRLHDGYLVYRLVTDFADFTNKINFEFTDAFWHNYDVAYLNVRDTYLKDDGWKVFRFTGTSFSIDEIKKTIGR